MRRPLALATAPLLLAGLLLTGTAAGPASARQPDPSSYPTPNDQEVAAAVAAMDLPSSVQPIDLAGSIAPLEQESRSGSTVTVRISADVLFAFGSADLSPAAKAQLGRIVARLKGVTGAVRVVGHTDSVGTAAANDRLSRARAESVRTELQTALTGVTVSATGRGSADPVAPNETGGRDDPSGRAKNRRVEITYNQ